MATRLPSFLQQPDPAAGLKTDAEPAHQPAAHHPAGEKAARTEPPVPPKAQIFRARPPKLLAKPLPIFRTRPPVLLHAAAPAAPERSEPAAPSAGAAPKAEDPTHKPARRRARAQPAAVSPPPAPDLRFRIVALTRLALGGRWRTEAMRSYSSPLLLWFTRGQGRITIAGSTHGYGSHNAVFLPPGTMHGFEMSGQVFGHAVHFPRGTGLVLPEKPLHFRFRDAATQNELTQMIDALQRELDGALPVSNRALEHHAGLLSVWLERQALLHAQQGVPDTAARRLAAAFTALVEKDFRAVQTVADYAARLGVTPTHLTRSCNLACGRSAHDILSDRIFYEARRLLRDTREPVNKIAAALGFTSAAYFSRAFQKVAGATPTAFRRQH